MPLDQTKARILESAGIEFAEKGFDLARIRTICDRAGANVAAVNYHFGDKQQLYTAAVLEAHRCGSDSDIAADDFDDTPASDLLRRYIHHFLSHVLAMSKRNTWHNTLMLREMLKPSEASAALVDEGIRPKFELLKRIIRKACPDVDDRKLNALCFSVVGQCLHYKMASTVGERLIGVEAFGALDVDYLAEHIAGFCNAALGFEPPVNEHRPTWSDLDSESTSELPEDLTVS